MSNRRFVAGAFRYIAAAADLVRCAAVAIAAKVDDDEVAAHMHAFEAEMRGFMARRLDESDGPQ